MHVAFEVPEDVALLLGENPASLGRAALEALALEGIRAGKITAGQARRLLGIVSRYEMDGFLKAHGVFLPLSTADVELDAATASRFLVDRPACASSTWRKSARRQQTPAP